MEDWSNNDNKKEEINFFSNSENKQIKFLSEAMQKMQLTMNKLVENKIIYEEKVY